MVSRRGNDTDTNEYYLRIYTWIRVARSNGNSVECVEPRFSRFVPRFSRELEFVESACPRSRLFNFRLPISCDLSFESIRNYSPYDTTHASKWKSISFSKYV